MSWICLSAASPFAVLRDPRTTWLLRETEASSAAVSKPMPPLAPSQVSIAGLWNREHEGTCNKDDMFFRSGNSHVEGKSEVVSIVEDDVP
jgi:hypothetical protein